MLDEVRSFFEALRKPVDWPKSFQRRDPRWQKEPRAESEKHRRLAVEDLDRLEAALIEVYEAGAEDLSATDFLDQVISIIRRKDKPAGDRVREIGNLTRSWATDAWQLKRRPGVRRRSRAYSTPAEPIEQVFSFFDQASEKIVHHSGMTDLRQLFRGASTHAGQRASSCSMSRIRGSPARIQLPSTLFPFRLFRPAALFDRGRIASFDQAHVRFSQFAHSTMTSADCILMAPRPTDEARRRAAASRSAWSGVKTIVIKCSGRRDSCKWCRAR
jgi:hypothetical protein